VRQEVPGRLVRRQDRRDGGVPRSRRRGGALLEGEKNAPGRADVRRRRNSLRLLRLRHALLRQRRDAPGGRSAGRPPARGRGSRRSAAEAPLRPGAALRRARGHGGGERPRPGPGREVSDLRGSAKTALDRCLGADRGGLCGRGRGVAASLFRSGIAGGFRQAEDPVFALQRITPSRKKWWKIIMTSSSFSGEIFMIDLTSQWPLIRDRTKPSCGEKVRSVRSVIEIASSGTLSPVTPSRSRRFRISRSASRTASAARPSEGSRSEATLNIR